MSTTSILAMIFGNSIMKFNFQSCATPALLLKTHWTQLQSKRDESKFINSLSCSQRNEFPMVVYLICSLCQIWIICFSNMYIIYLFLIKWSYFWSLHHIKCFLCIPFNFDLYKVFYLIIVGKLNIKRIK